MKYGNGNILPGRGLGWGIFSGFLSSFRSWHNDDCANTPPSETRPLQPIFILMNRLLASTNTINTTLLVPEKYRSKIIKRRKHEINIFVILLKL